MRNENGRISLNAILMIALLLFLMSGWIKYRATEFLFSLGFFHPTKAQVEAAIKREYKNDIVTCRETTGDWDYICDHTNFPPFAPGKSEKLKWGVRVGWLSPIKSEEGLALSEPTPTTREQNKRRLQEDTNKRILSHAPFVLTAVRDTDLKAMGVDGALARRLENAIRLRDLKRVNDLLAVEGMNRDTLERIRPYIRAN
jgi:hypothetical protein